MNKPFKFFGGDEIVQKTRSKRPLDKRHESKNQKIKAHMQTFPSWHLHSGSFPKLLVLGIYKCKIAPLICEVLAKLTGTEGPGP